MAAVGLDSDKKYSVTGDFLIAIYDANEECLKGNVIGAGAIIGRLTSALFDEKTIKEIE